MASSEFQVEKVAIIGAGISGLVAAKECLEEGLQPTVYEARPYIGGQWHYEEPDPLTGEAFSSVYDGVVSNTCALRSQFSDFPMDPAQYPDYPTHRDYLRYIHEYAAHFGLEKYILLNAEVLSCDRQGHQWKVATRTTEELFDALFICTGKESVPYIPEVTGLERFEGRAIHSHIYRQPDVYAGKRVAVIGLGSSAVDISSEVSKHAASCHLITQRGGWVLPRYVNGKLVESLQSRLVEYLLPRSILTFSYELIHRLVVGEVPTALKPNHGILTANPVVSNEFLDHIRAGSITPHRASVESFTERTIVLSNGETIEVDEVIFCTGYNATMPVIAEETYRGEKQNSVRLYRFVNSPTYDNLFFLGLVEFLGPIHPTVELQARWAVASLTRRIHLPSREKMQKEIKKAEKEQEKNFVNSRRHTIVVPTLGYQEALAADLGVKPNFRKLVQKYVLSRKPAEGLSIVNFYYNGMITSAPYRLFGHGNKPELAEATILRMARHDDKLSETEEVFLTADRVVWNATE
ncbi:Dimethylaniline monooxygenase [N-oxide-forming] 2 [Talaromyces pinophilus]|nr:Dimethylaniline monooxygenase [N-oxide-forming] 2 [Talaromyces pinophilus]